MNEEKTVLECPLQGCSESISR